MNGKSVCLFVFLRDSGIFFVKRAERCWVFGEVWCLECHTIFYRFHSNEFQFPNKNMKRRVFEIKLHVPSAAKVFDLTSEYEKSTL